MKKTISILFFCFVFCFSGRLSAKALRSPDSVIASIFKGWRLQNKTYISLHSLPGQLSTFGEMVSTFNLISYSIDWQKKYKNYVIIKTSVKTKSVDKFFKIYYIYWLLKKIDGKWVWENGYSMAKNVSYSYVYWVNKNN